METITQEISTFIEEYSPYMKDLKMGFYTEVKFKLNNH